MIKEVQKLEIEQMLTTKRLQDLMTQVSQYEMRFFMLYCGSPQPCSEGIKALSDKFIRNRMKMELYRTNDTLGGLQYDFSNMTKSQIFNSNFSLIWNAIQNHN